ncbi:MAG: tetratricopeptide repeat protein [Nitrospinota bacterium]|jgi:tetratricopeptide (TPR) repeat protein|nr:tetratricopeptide repeat protein [Nitrospinota bacterium]
MGKKNRRRTISDNPAQPNPARDFQSLLKTTLNHLKSGKVVEAEEAYKEILRLLEDSIGAGSGSASMKEGSDPPSLKAAFTRDPEIIKIFSEVHNNLGVALQFQGKTGEAAENYQRTIALNPENIDALNNMGVVMQGLGRWGDAADFFRRTISIDSDHPDAHANLGTALMSMGEFEEAIAVSRHALKINPRKEVALNTLGNAQKNLGRFDEVIENYGKTLDLNPGNIDALGSLGTIFLSKGNLDSALASFRRAGHSRKANFMNGNTLKVNLEWLEGKKIQASARGSHLTVDRIYEDGREGMGFRPTELYLSALGACTMGTLLNFCENMNIPIENFSVEVEGRREKNPERINEVEISISLTGEIPGDRVATLERVAKGCRVHYTMTHPPKISLNLTVTDK